MENEVGYSEKIKMIFNETITLTIEEFSFHTLSNDVLKTIFKDGRIFAHFIEHQLSKDFNLKHVSGCKSHDIVDPDNPDIKYEQKTFTKKGCNFTPSNMIGQGRKFNKDVFVEKASKLNYIIVSNVNFPEIKIKFMTGTDLLSKYPNGKIPKKDFNQFFA